MSRSHCWEYVKGESYDRSHLLPYIPITSSGINMRSALWRLLETKGRLRHKDGLAIADKHGKMLKMRELDELLHEVLEEIFEFNQNLFSGDIKTLEDVRKFYQCFRLFRRGSDTRALEQKVSPADIDIVNRWRKVEAGSGRRPGFNMQQHYAQFDLLLKPFLRYTLVM